MTRQGDRRASQQEGHASADGGPHRINTVGLWALLRREIVGDQRGARRAERRLAGADPQPRGEQARETARQAASHGGRAPDGDPRRDQTTPVYPVGQQTQGQTEHRVKEGEGRALQQAHEGVGDVQVRLDRLDEQAKGCAIDDGKSVGDHQGHHDPPSIAAVRPRRVSRLQLVHRQIHSSVLKAAPRVPSSPQRRRPRNLFVGAR